MSAIPMGEVVTHTQVTLLRHGEPAGGVRYRGITDDPLTDKGWQQMQTAMDNMDNDNMDSWDIILSSPLCRCFDFATQLSKAINIPIEQDNCFAEMCFGEWEGKTTAQIQDQDAQALFQFWQDPYHHAPPGSEPLSVFEERVVTGWKNILSRYKGQCLLLITHAGIMRIVLKHLLDIPWSSTHSIQLDFAACLNISVYHNQKQDRASIHFHSGRN